MIHELKCWPEYFSAVLRGDKTFEVPYNDRDFKVDDEILLREYEPFTESYTGRETWTCVSYVLKNHISLKEGYVILGIIL